MNYVLQTCFKQLEMVEERYSDLHRKYVETQDAARCTYMLNERLQDQLIEGLTAKRISDDFVSKLEAILADDSGDVDGKLDRIRQSMGDMIERKKNCDTS